MWFLQGLYPDIGAGLRRLSEIFLGGRRNIFERVGLGRTIPG